MAFAYKLSGWHRQLPDPRDHRFYVPRRITDHLPPWIDLQPGMGPYLDQRNLGTCGPFAVTELINYDQKVQGLSVVELSELFIYYYTRALMGTVSQDSGVNNRTLLKALAKYGYCVESLWSYDTTKFTVKPPQVAIDAAAKSKLVNYAAVAQLPSQMQGTLANGRPFLFGFDCFQQIMSDEAAATGIIAMPKKGETSIGGHDMPALGFTTVDRPGVLPGNKWPANTYKLRQHWTNADGSPWGDGGYGYVAADYAHDNAYASDFWVINAIPGSQPTGQMTLQLNLSALLTPPHGMSGQTGTYTLTPVPAPKSITIIVA